MQNYYLSDLCNLNSLSVDAEKVQMQYVSMDIALLWLKMSQKNRVGERHPLFSSFFFFFLRAETSPSHHISRTVPLPSSTYVLLRSGLRSCHIQQVLFNIHHLFNHLYAQGWSFLVNSSSGDHGKSINVKLQMTMCSHSYGYIAL